jgi:hypothetical protein
MNALFDALDGLLLMAMAVTTVKLLVFAHEQPSALRYSQADQTGEGLWTHAKPSHGPVAFAPCLSPRT